MALIVKEKKANICTLHIVKLISDAHCEEKQITNGNRKFCVETNNVSIKNVNRKSEPLLGYAVNIKKIDKLFRALVRNSYST